MAKNRNDNNIAGSDKSCTSDRCILDAHLLKTAGKCQKNTAADTAENQCTGLFYLLLRRWQFLFLGRFSVIQKENAWNQDDSSDDASNSVESKRTHVIHTNALGYESHTPDGGCQQQKQRIFKLCLFHKIPSLHSNIGKRQLFNRHTDTKQRNICNHIMRKEKKEARIRRVQILFGDFLGFLLINIIIKDKIYIVVGRILRFWKPSDG